MNSHKYGYKGVISHECHYDSPIRFYLRERGYGVAVTSCTEDEEGLWVDNGEYSNNVNFCPFCGYEAKTLVGITPDITHTLRML